MPPLPYPVLSEDLALPEENPVFEALDNDLIFPHITQYLTHRELKNASAVCKNFFQKIRASKRMQESSVFRLTSEDFSNKHFDIYNENCLIWKFIEVHVDLKFETLCLHETAVRQRFQHAESVTVFLQDPVSEENPRKVHSLRLQNILSSVVQHSGSSLKMFELNYASNNDIPYYSRNCSTYKMLRNMKLKKKTVYISSDESESDFSNSSDEEDTCNPDKSKLWDTIARIHGKSLTDLRLTCYDFWGTSELLFHLSRLRQLKAVDIDIAWSPRSDYFSTPSILKALPKTITRLTLRRVYHGRWSKICEHSCSKCPGNCECEPKCECLPRSPADNNILQLLQFSNLTELAVIGQSPTMVDGGPIRRFAGDDSIIDNPMLQLIIQNLKKLRILRLAHCYMLTDSGFTDLTPLSDLKDLRELMIRNCPHVNDRAFLSVIKFRHLISLYLVALERVGAESDVTPHNILAGIVLQNPSLTSITMHSHLPDIVQRLKSVNPGLKNVCNAHTQDCGSDWYAGDLPWENKFY